MLTLTVTTLADEPAATSSQANETNDGDGLALREAIAVARQYVLEDADVEIVFAPSLAGGTAEVDIGPLVVDFDLAIHGDALGGGAGDVTIFGGTQVFPAAGIFEITGGSVSIDNLAITGAGLVGPGFSPEVSYLAGVTIGPDAVVDMHDVDITDNWYSTPGGRGGGIRNAGTLSLSEVNVIGNGAGWDIAGGAGGGIYNAGTLTMDTVEVSGNFASGRDVGDGAGIYNDGDLVAMASLIAENTGGHGAGMFNAGEATLINTTLALNSTSLTRFGDGSGIRNAGELNLIHATVAGHAGASGSAPEIQNTGTVNLANSIVFDGNGPGVDNEGGVGSLNLAGGNILGATVYSGTTPTGTTSSGQLFWSGVRLDSSAGPLRTINLRDAFTNPAVDAGDSSVAVDAGGAPLATDARGLARDVDIAMYGGGTGASVDLGAVERPTLTPELIVDGAPYRVYGHGWGQDDGEATITPDGSTLSLTTDAWKEISNFRLAADTVLSFDFSSTDEGEIQGIGLDIGGLLREERVFQLLGTQTYGRQDFVGQAEADGEVVHYEIALGELLSEYVGRRFELVFINDDDAKGGSDATFANISFETPPVAEDVPLA